MNLARTYANVRKPLKDLQQFVKKLVMAELSNGDCVEAIIKLDEAYFWLLYETIASSKSKKIVPDPLVYFSTLSWDTTCVQDLM